LDINEAVREQRIISVVESSQVSEARQRATALAELAGLGETQTGVCALIASEMGSNLVKHAKEGQILLRALMHGPIPGIEMLSIDRGPGMGNVNRALQDGHSTAGSSGTGLGALSRVASTFDIHSKPGQGTVLVARVWKDHSPRRDTFLGTVPGVVRMPIPGETVSGDAWLFESSGKRTLCAVADGLGHGPLAAEASSAAMASLLEHRDAPLVEQIELAHETLKSTRGAALGIAEILHDRGIINFSGIGNIMATVLQDGVARHMVSQNGILGHQMRQAKEFQYPWSESATLVLCSDGISTRWDLTSYVGLMMRDASLIAATLYRDYGRRTDDATVLVFGGPRGTDVRDR
jgi:anti-sigma regulatory factor (Ser/Thr protein kinase)